MKKFWHLFLLLTAFFTFSSCGDEDEDGDNGGEPENTEATCTDEIDNDGDGSTDCIDVECKGVCAEIAARDPREADVSGMPVPDVTDEPAPDGTPGNLVVLDWAGFKAAVSYTFDDTQPTHIDHYDALNAQGIHVTYFATTANGGSSSFDETFSQAVVDGHEIGNHTVHHCRADLTDCGSGSALDSPEAEIEEANTYIEEQLGQEGVWTMATPYGDGNWNSYAEEYFFLNRSIINGTVAPGDSANPFNLPSKMLAGEETVDDLNQIIDSVRDKGEWQIICLHSILPGADWYAGVALESITGSMQYLKDLGDVWADSMVNVGAYWIGQMLVTDADAEESDETTVWTWTVPDNFPPGKYVRVTVDGGTLSQEGKPISWSEHGYYEISLDAQELTLAP